MRGGAGVCEGCKMLGFGVGWAAEAGLMYDGSSICTRSKRHFVGNDCRQQSVVSSSIYGKQGSNLSQLSCGLTKQKGFPKAWVHFA